MRLRFVYRAWKARWRDQKLEIEIARQYLHRGDLAVDAGANKGAYLYWLRRFVGSSGTVLAFEPQPTLARYLTAIQSKLAWRNVHIRAVALSDRPGKSTLHVPGKGVSPGASLESSAFEGHDGQRYECEIDTLDRQIEEFKAAGPLKFCKVDVEGHELSLFQGALRTLERDKPALLFECEARHLTRHSMREVFDFLGQLAYRGYYIRDNLLAPVERFNVELHQARQGAQFWNAPDYYNNFLFVCGSLPMGLAQRLVDKK